MKVTQNMVVELVYELVVDGQIVDKMTSEKPLDFIHGVGSLLPKFEENIEGLEPGAEFSFTLTPEEGYGTHDPNKVIDLPKEAFAVNGEIREDLLVVGSTVPMLNRMGQVVPGVILEVAEHTVKMDLNSQMADKTLNFSGKIISVREATDKELKEGLHGEFVHSNCGCHGGCHGDGDCCGEGGDCGCGNEEGNCGCNGGCHAE